MNHSMNVRRALVGGDALTAQEIAERLGMPEMSYDLGKAASRLHKLGELHLLPGKPQRWQRTESMLTPDADQVDAKDARPIRRRVVAGKVYTEPFRDYRPPALQVPRPGSYHPREGRLVTTGPPQYSQRHGQ